MGVLWPVETEWGWTLWQSRWSLLGVLASGMRVSVQFPAHLLLTQPPDNVLGKAAGGGPSVGVPAIHKRDRSRVPDS